MKIGLWHFFLLFLAVLPLSGRAEAEDAVWDPLEIARLSQRSAELALANSLMVGHVTALTSMARANGGGGTPPSLAFATYAAMPALAGDGISSPPNLSQASRLAGGLIAPGTTLTDAGLSQKRAAGLLDQATLDGYGLALSMRNFAAASPAVTADLAQKSASSLDLRGDVAVNTAAGLALLRQIGGLEAQLAAILEIRSIRVLTVQTPQPATESP